MRAAVALTCATLALAGCSAGAPTGNEQALGNAESAASRGQVVDRDTVLTERWQSLFDQPDKVTAALNEFGYKLAAPTTDANGRWTARGTEQLLPKAGAPVTVTTNVEMTGPAKDKVDAVRFTFAVRKNGEVTRKRDLDAALYPTRIVRGVLGRFEVAPVTEVIAALRKGDSATGTEHGGTVSVVAAPLPDTDADHAKRLDVTITPAGASIPGTTRK